MFVGFIVFLERKLSILCRETARTDNVPAKLWLTTNFALRSVTILEKARRRPVCFAFSAFSAARLLEDVRLPLLGSAPSAPSGRETRVQEGKQTGFCFSEGKKKGKKGSRRARLLG
jgi:hypothetical protein